MPYTVLPRYLEVVVTWEYIYRNAIYRNACVVECLLYAYRCQPLGCSAQ